MSRACALTAALASLGGAACGSPDAVGPAPQTGPVELVLSNALDVPVRISIGEGAIGNVGPGSTGRITVPSGQLAVTWAPFKRTAGDGATIPDDFSGGTIAVGGVRLSATITNAVAGTLYFTPIVVNRSGRRVGLAIADHLRVRCLGAQDPADAVGTPMAWGYYRLIETTTLRVYPTADCTGDGWRAWGTGQLAGYVRDTGVILLTFPGF